MPALQHQRVALRGAGGVDVGGDVHQRQRHVVPGDEADVALREAAAPHAHGRGHLDAFDDVAGRHAQQVLADEEGGDLGAARHVGDLRRGRDVAVDRLAARDHDDADHRLVVAVAVLNSR